MIETIVVPGKYKAIAITLPKPEEYGGAYVLEVPRANGDPIYTLMEKEHPGVTSGQIQHASGTHILAGENPPPDENRTPNIIIDGTARPFTDLDVGIYKGNAKQETLLPTFVDTVYGYTFYVPSDTEKFWVDFSFDTSYVEGENSVSSKVILVSLNGNDITSDAGSSSPVSLSDLDINEQGKATLWIKKTDTTTAGAKTVSYKITIVVKEKYDFTLNVSALSKIYDGYPVDPKITSMIEGAGFHTTVGGNGLNTSYTESTTPTDPTVDAKTVSVNGTSVSYDLQEISNDNKGKVTYTVSFSYRSYNSNYTGTYSFYVDKDGNVTHGKSITFGSNYNGIQISGNGDTMSLQQQTRTATLTITKLVSQEINQISDSDISTTEEKLKKEILDAQEAGNDEFTSASEEVPITGGEGTAIYEVMIGEIRNEYRVEFEFSGTATVTVTYSEGTDHTAKMTQEDKAQIIFTFEKDSSGDGNYEVLLGTGTYETLLSLNELPKDAGKYRVHVFLNSEKYEAEGDATFEIFKKDVHIVAIENWLKYVTPNELSTYDGVITDPGQVYFEGVISGESVSLEAGAEFQYVDTGDPGYLDDVSYGEQKIRITNAALDGHSITNYYLTGVTDGVCYVPGQISYSTSGTMFRKVDDLITSLWRKFYPIEESDYLTWETNDGVFTDNRIDYHSPVPDGANADNGYSGGTVGVHREYVKLRTTGDTSARYSIDIEFGAMQYQFTKRVWNVNTGEYEAVDGESKWNGNNGTNNAVTITNRSNTEIYYEIEFEIDFMYAAVTALADSGIHAALYDTAGQLAAGSMIGDRITSTAGATSILALPSAAPSNTAHFGTAQSKTFELVLSGTPSSITESDNLNYTNVGTITVKIVDPLA